MADPITLMAIAGTAISAVGTLASGVQAKKKADYEAKQQERMAGEARAVGQHNALARRREQELVESAALATAASQGGASDASVIDIFGDIAAEGERNVLTETYKGETQARQLEVGAHLTRFGGKQAMTAAMFDAAGSLLTGGSKIFQRHGAKASAPASTATAVPYT